MMSIKLDALSLRAAECLLLLTVCLDLASPDSAPRAIGAFVSLFLANALLLISFLSSPSTRLAPHWRHFLLFFVSSALLLCFIVFHATGQGQVVDNDLRYYFGATILFALAVTWIKTHYLFPLRGPPLHRKKAGPHKIAGTHSFTIPVRDQGKVYYTAVQVWFPLPAKPKESHGPTLLWTSGNPSTQQGEAKVLFDTICREFGQLWFVLSHLALNRHSSPPIYYTASQHGELSPESSASSTPYNSIPNSPAPIEEDDVFDAEAAEFEAATLSATLAAASAAASAAAESVLASAADQLRNQGLDLESRPVAIYSHGLFSWRQLATSTVLHLVSHGFVVFSLDHSPTAMVARLPAHLRVEGDEEGAGAAEVPEKNIHFDFRPPKEWDKDDADWYSTGLERRATELTVLMDYIDRERHGSLKAYRLDSERLHLFGHSLGSSTVAAVCARDSRPRSCVLLDAWMYPLSSAELDSGARCPVLSLSSDLWDVGASQTELRTRFIENTKRRTGKPSCSFNLKVLGTDHQNFCDIFLLVERSLLRGMIGPAVDPYRVMKSLNGLICDYFLRVSDSTISSTPVGQAEAGTAAATDAVSDADALPGSEDRLCYAVSVDLAATTTLRAASPAPAAAHVPAPVPASVRIAQARRGLVSKDLVLDAEYTRLSLFICGAERLGDELLDALCVAESPALANSAPW